MMISWRSCNLDREAFFSTCDVMFFSTSCMVISCAVAPVPAAKAACTLCTQPAAGSMSCRIMALINVTAGKDQQMAAVQPMRLAVEEVTSDARDDALEALPGSVFAQQANRYALQVRQAAHA